MPPPVSRLIPSLACALAACLWPASSRAQEPGYELEIKPSICVSPAGGDNCTMSLEASWRGPKGAVCLRRAGADSPLQCWREQNAGRVRLSQEFHDDMVYQLVSLQNRRVLAEQEVRVVSRDLRDSRRRRRHVWSIL